MRNKGPLNKDRMYMYVYIYINLLMYSFIYREREREREAERGTLCKDYILMLSIETTIWGIRSGEGFHQGGSPGPGHPTCLALAQPPRPGKLGQV